MKSVKNFVFAVLLASVLAVSAPAGEVDGPGFHTGPPPSSTPTPAPVIGTSDEDSNVVTAEISDYLFFEALAALLSVY